jgi:IS30 family transposase
VSVREIARRLDRSASTVSRELRRNTAAHDRGSYDVPLAHSRAWARSTRPSRSRLASDEQLRAEVQETGARVEPEQIAAHLRAAFPHRPGWHLCYETIYQALYRGSRGGLNRTLTKRLRTGRPLRKRRRRPDERPSRYVVPHQRIENRPAIVTERIRLGDWEATCSSGR